jgi:hypothetical protein
MSRVPERCISVIERILVHVVAGLTLDRSK